MERDEAFTRYVDERWPVLVRSAVLLGCTRAEAEDLVQTTLVRCYVAWEKVSSASNRDAYVYRVLVNCHHDSHRRRWWRERPTDEVPDAITEDRTGQVDDADAVQRALRRLSAPHRQVVVLRYYAHLGEQQIAEALRIAPGTVKSRLSRALAQLSTDLDVTALRGGRAS
ncbi:SigE family RNA polymerase sigma factor [Blastococcus sp. SYSU DS0973]